jgi:hypothetical protein
MTAAELVGTWQARDESILSYEMSRVATVQSDKNASFYALGYFGHGPDRRWYGTVMQRVRGEAGYAAYGDIRGYVNDRLHGISFEQSSGVIRDDDNVTRSAADSLNFVLGWALDSYSCVPLSHMAAISLDQARLPDHDSSTLADDTIAFPCSLADGMIPAIARVRFDGSHDYAPQMIEIRHSCLNHVQWRITINEWTQVASIWMPLSAQVEVGTFSVTPEQGATLQAALRDAGLADQHDGMNPKVIDVYRKVVPAIFGGDEVPWHVTTTIQLNFEYLKLNQRIPESRFAPSFSGDFDVFDGFTGKWMNPTKKEQPSP